MEEGSLILPLNLNIANIKYCKLNEEFTSLVSEWMNARSDFIAEIWSKPINYQKIDASYGLNEIADKIIKILTHRLFNFQSKRNLSEIMKSVRQNILRQICSDRTLKLFLLYNGGYRASPLLDNQTLIFEPDQTELMLLYQIALLNQKISALYNIDIEFFIVVNNGVAKWVNDIPIADTENYTKKLRKMIAFYGAEKNVKVVLQSELVGFDASISFQSCKSQSLLTEDEHLIVERFLGRTCSREEAEHRLAIYKIAESKWANDLSVIIESIDGIVMRQIAHPDMLSFRPFPGGAIRIQNGTFGFKYQKKCLIPKLITSKSVMEQDVMWVPYNLPW